MSKRAFILGLDSATFDVLDPLLEAGRLPNFARICSKGAVARMKSTIPPRTAPAWVSLMTGQNPGRHGISDFWGREFNEYDTMTGGLVSSCSYAGKTIFDVLGHYGKRVAALFVPMTYPSWRINGVMIAGPPLAPDSDDKLSYPHSLHSQLGVTQEVHLFPPSIEKGVDREETVADLLHMERARAELALKLWDSGQYDCLMVVLEAIDIVQHRLWANFLDGSQNRFKETIPAFYENADSILASILARLKSDDLLFVVSDHGMTSHPATILNTNVWLAQQGWLRFKSRRSMSTGAASFAQTIVHRLLPERLFVRLKHRLKSSPNRIARSIRMSRSSMSAIDWSLTSAYRFQLPDLPVDGINLNLRGREPEGILPEEKAEELKAQIQQRLLQLQDPSTQEPVIEKVYRREEIFWGPHAHLMPDLVIEFANGYRAGSASIDEQFTTTPQIEISKLSGTHSLDGIFIAFGSAFQGGISRQPLRIIDFSSNLFYALGHPIPTFVDGKVQRNLFTSDYRARREICREDLELSTPGSTTYSADEISEMEERLRLLGYMQ